MKKSFLLSRGAIRRAIVFLPCLFAVFLLAVKASAQLSVTTSPSGPQVVDSGSTLTVELAYAWSSTTANVSGTELSVRIPLEFGGSSPADFDALTFNPHIDSVTFDTGTRELVFDFVDPLDAGASGVLKFSVAHPNGTTEDGATSVIDIDFSAPGETPSTTSISVEANASSNIDISKATIGDIQPAQGEATPYQITVNNNQGLGNYDAHNVVVTDTLPPGATLVSVSPAADNTVVDDKGNADPTDDVTTLTWNFGSIPAGSAKGINMQVQYDDPLGTVVTNVADFTGQDPFGAPVSGSVSDPRTVSAPDPSAGFTKSASTTKVSLSDATDDVTETISYSFDISNSGNVLLNDFVVEDSFPAGFVPTRLWTGYDTALSQQNNVKIEYQLDSAPGTWVEHADSPFLSPFDTDPMLIGNNEVDLTVLGGTVIALRWTFDELPIAYNNGGGTAVFGEYRAPATVGSTVTNDAKASDPTDTSQVTVGSTIGVEIVGASPRPAAGKSIVGSSSGNPTDTLTYRITVTNSYGASATLDSPVASDVLPPNVTFVPGSVVASPALTSFTEGVDGGTGRPLLTFDWTGQNIAAPVVNADPGSGSSGDVTLSSFTVEFDVTIDPGTPPQALTNSATLTYTNPILNDSSGSANVTPNSVFTVLEAGLLDARKWVVGDLDLPSGDPDDLDFGDGDDDQAYETRFPDTGNIVPGGQFRYRVSGFNPGNEPLNNVKVMEILPWVGDIGVVATGDSRGSEWQANLIQHASQTGVFPDATVYDINGVPSTQAVSVQWSTSTNPVRSDLDTDLGDPTGGDVGTFNSGALPADLTTVRSLLFEFPGMTLDPLESFEFYFYLTAPDDAPSDTVAWNSIGRAADIVTSGTSIPPSEPLKVGVKLDSVSLGNLVWIDSTAGSPATTDNGIYDSGVENVMEGAQVELFQYVDGVLQRAQAAYEITTGGTDEVTPSGSPLLTDENGLYEFTELMPSGTSYDGVLYGDFVVQVSPPAGLTDQYVAGSTGAGGYEADPNDNGDNNNNGIAYAAGNVLRSGDINLTLDGEPLADGQTEGDDADGNLTVDFAYVANEAAMLLANLGNVVWLDEDADGTRDGSEALIEGATVEIFDAATGLPVLDAHGNPAVPFDSLGNPLTDAKTGADGVYEFIDLLPGDYVVKITPPAPPAGTDPYELTPVNGLLDDQNHGELAAANLGNIATGDIVSPTVTLAAGDTDNKIDFGLIRPLSLGDLVWIDGSSGDANADNDNQDSVGSPGEAPLAGVTVELFDAAGAPATHIDGSLVSSETTDANGNYLFENLLPGDYIVRVAAQMHYEITTDFGNADNDNTDSNALLSAGLGSLNAGDIVSDPVTLGIGEEPVDDGDTNPDSNLTVDFGFVPVPADVVSLGNRVWFDQNGNGIQDGGEPNIDGATVELFYADGTPAVDAYLDQVDPVVTSGGAYSFGDLLPDDYIVKVTPPAGDYFVTPVTSADTSDGAPDTDNNGSELGVANGSIPAGSIVSPTVTLAVGEDDPKIDFGFTQTVSVGNYVWVDSTDSGATQGNGIQDAGENAFPGATVWLLIDQGGGVYVQANDADGNPVAADTTDANGLYEFSNLLPGSDYVVAVEEPENYDLTPVSNPDPNVETGPYLTDNNGVSLITMNIDGQAGDESLIISAPVTLFAGTEPLLDDGEGAAFGTPTDANGNGAVDFGLVPESTVVDVSVGDIVWLDEDRDGLLNNGEAGIAGATVELLDASGNPVLDADLNTVAAIVTDSSGAYNFSNLIPGDYKIRVTPPTGHAVVKEGGLDPDADATNNDNNALQVTGQTYAETPLITLEAGDMDPNVDIGLVELVSIGDYVWFDLNSDGAQLGESGVENANVSLWMETDPNVFVAATDAYGNAITAQSTDTDGLYAFGDLYPGVYKVRVDPPAGLILTPHGGLDPDADDSNTDNNGIYVTGESYVESAPVSLEANEEPTTDGGGTPDDNNGNYSVDFGFIEPLSLGDTVWWDRNGDGVQDGGPTEPGISGVPVSLWVDNGGTLEQATDYLGNPVAAVNTDSSGNYSFGDLLPGDYIVRVETPADHVLTAGVNADPQTDNNGNEVAGQTYVQSAPVNLAVRGETGDGDADYNNDPTVDFGFVQTVSVGNYVWLDRDGDGTQGVPTSEPPLENVSVALFEADGTTVAKDYEGNDVAAVLTDANGFYEFSGLLEGDYIVRVTPPADHLITPNGGADPDADDSNTDNNGYVSGANVESLPVTLTVDQEPTTDGGGLPDDNNGNRSVDFGFVQTVSIGSVVFDDTANKDGAQGADPLLLGATVELFEADGVTPATDVNGDPVASIDTTTTSGAYEFDNLYPGDYVVRVTPPAGYAATPINNNDPGDETGTFETDSNGQPVSGELYAQSVPVTLTVDGEPLGDGTSSAGKDANGNGTVDFGFIQTVSIGNLVWLDSNVDGDLTGEDPLEGATVSLWVSDGSGGLQQATDASGAAVADIVTGTDGLYEFTNLFEDDYVVRVEPPAGYLRTPNGGADPDADASNTDNNGLDVAGQSYVQSEFVTLSIGGEPLTDGTSANPVDANGNLTVDFGFYQPVSLGDIVWWDRDGDGAQGAIATEPGIAGATVTLIDNATGLRAKDKDGVDVPDFTTLADGLYNFDDLLPGDYKVRVTPPADYVLTGGTGGTAQTDNDGLDVGEAYTESGVVTLTSLGEIADGDADENNDPTVDFGFVQTVSIGNYVWMDANGDGVQDVLEDGIQNVSVALYEADGTTVAKDYQGNDVTAVLTDSDGLYEFTGLLEGDYVVRVVPPANTLLTPHGGLDPDADASNTDNNGQPVAGQTYVQSAPVTLEVDDEPTGDGGGSPDDNNGNLTVDFGFVETVAIGSIVFQDPGYDGDLSGDIPLEGALVELFAADGSTPATDVNGDPVASITTSATGTYLFDNLYPDSYVVRVTPPAGWAPTPVNEDDPNGNASDTDSNGQAVLGETYAQSVPVELTVEGEPLLDGVSSNSKDENGNGTIDFGFVETVSLGDYVWLDADVDGDQAGETALAGATVTLWVDNGGTLEPATDASGAATPSVVTDTDGLYAFDGLLEGDYIVRVEPPADYLLTPGVGVDPQTDNNGQPVAGQTYVHSAPVTLTVGGETADGDADDNNDPTIDFGFYQPVSLGDYVWFDANGDGVQDGGESGIAGATVTLVDENGVRAKDKDGVDVPDFTTLADGAYSFDDLLPGDYKVRVTPPATSDYVLTAGVNADPQTDNNGLDVGETYVESALVTLASGAETGDGDNDANNNPTIDFGFTETVSIGDFVWLDSNVNGVQDDGPSSGVSGALVELFAADGTTPATDYTGAPVASQTTGSDGLYEFTDLLPGTYVVRVTPPAEHVLTPFGGGDPDGDDSNTDNNGIAVPNQDYVQSAAVDLTVNGEPTTDGGGSPDDNNGNLSVDFGFVPGVSLGDTVWLDDGGTTGTANDGLQTGDEAGIQFVTVQLFPAVATDLTDPAQMIAEVETDGSGNYQFNDLLPGDYIVYIPAAEFTATETLELLASSNGNGAYAPSPEDNVQADDNGTPHATTGGVASLPISLTIGGEDADDAFDSDSDNNSTVDFGFTPKVSLGDTVWADTDNSGVQDGGELGIQDVIVQLFPLGADPQSASPLAQTATGPNGDYLFDNLAPGDYFVHIPASEFGTGEPLSGLASSNANGTAPIAPDPNGDVDLDDNGTPDLVGGGVSTAPIELTIDGGPGGTPEDNTTLDLGFTPSVSLGNYVWVDTDNSGTVDGSESPIDGVVVQLFAAGADVTDPAQKLAETTTDLAGLYQFDNLAPGDYIVYIPASEFGGGEPLSGLASSNGNGNIAPSPEDNVNDDDNGTPENNGGVISAPVTLSVGGETGDGDSDPDNNDSVDFGFTPSVSLGDTVWLDMGGTGSGTVNDGTQDGDEPGISVVTVELYPAGADPTSSDPLLTDVTDTSGNYLFDQLAPGDYFVFVPDQPALIGLVSSTGNGQATDPDDDLNLDDNGEPVSGGFQSGDVTLAVATEPTDDGDASDDSNLSVDFGFTDPTDLVSLGDTVWEDVDNSGTINNGESGIADVVVELYQLGDVAGTDTPYFTTTTDASGNYSFDNLNPGEYIVFLPAENFAPAGPLFGSLSSDGNGVAPDPDDDVESDDNGEPGNGGIVAAPIELTTGGEFGGNDNPSVDFGIYDPFEDTWEDYIAAPNGSGSDPADSSGNSDGDLYNDLAEYALGMSANSGAGAGDNGGFCAVLGGETGTSGTVDAFFTRPIGLPDVTYTLQTAPSIGSPPAWAPWSGPAPTIVDNGDGTETVSFVDLESNVGAQGIVRLQIDLGGSNPATTYSQTYGWSTVSADAECETVSNPYAPKEIFSGTVDSVSGADNEVLDLTTSAGSGDIGALMTDPDRPYYIEIVNGACEGHRIDVASATATSITLDTSSPRNTLSPIPDLSGEQIVLRPHTVLDDVVTAQAFIDSVTPANNDNPATAGRVLLFDNANGWSTYFAYNNSGAIVPAQWTSADNSFLENVGDAVLSGPNDQIVVIEPCAGFYVHSKAQAVDVLMTGIVREWDFACPLSVGYNFVGSGYPEDQSPNDRDMSDAFFTGTTDPVTADQIEFWMSDGAVQGIVAYDSHFRVDCGDYTHWTTQENSSLATEDAIEMFKIQRASFINSRAGHAKTKAGAWTWPVPWDADAGP